METYSLLRHFADSWALLALTLVFTGVILWAWRPAAKSIFRNDTKPAAGSVRGQKEA